MTQNCTAANNFSMVGSFPPPKKTQTSFSPAQAVQAPLPASIRLENDGLQPGAELKQKYSRSPESKPYLSRIFILPEVYSDQSYSSDLSEQEKPSVVADDSWANFKPFDPSQRYEFIPEPLGIRVEFPPYESVGCPVIEDGTCPLIEDPNCLVIQDANCPGIEDSNCSDIEYGFTAASYYDQSIFEPANSVPKNYYDAFNVSTVKPYAWKGNAPSYYSLTKKRSDVMWGSKLNLGVSIAGSEPFASNIQYFANELNAEGKNEKHSL